MMAHPTRFDESDRYLSALRKLALKLPEAREKISHGRPNFFTKKVFASYGASVKGDHSSRQWSQSVLFLPDHLEREALLCEGRFFVPAYVGAYGWIGLNFRATKPDWREVAELVEMSYCNTATKTLIKQLDAR